MYDVAIIGGGICGASMAYELSKYNLKVVVLEKENDVACATTKANSAIVHAGYDPAENTKMAKFNVLGNSMIETLCHDLDVPYKKLGSLVLAFSDEDLIHLNRLYERGVKNGVPNMEILSTEQVLKREPNVNPSIKGALLANSAAVIGPWELAIALLDTAVINGCEVKLNAEVIDISKDENGFKILTKTDHSPIFAKYIVNASGLYGDKIYNMLEPTTFTIKPDKGQYFLLDKTQANVVNHVVFQCPTEKGKGILVSQTAHGNLIVGPDAQDINCPSDVAVSSESLAYIKEMADLTTTKINYRENIRNFAGNRAVAYDNNGKLINDFIIDYAASTDKFINIAGIKSPGLSSAPAIAVHVVEMLKNAGLSLVDKKDFVSTRRLTRMERLSPAEKNALIAKNPLFGRVICRCETVTEGEIVEAIHSPIMVTTVEGIKRRVRAGMGRCSGGFCSPKVLEIIAKQLHIDYSDVLHDKIGSNILLSQEGEK